MIKSLLLLSLSVVLFASLKVGEIPDRLVIDPKDGGYVSGGSFDSSVLKKKIHIVIYADPDEQSSGEELTKYLDEVIDKVSPTVLQRYIVINLNDTWLPNYVVSKLIASRQKDDKRTIFVIDKSSIVSKKWGVKRDSFVCMVLDESGKVLYINEGPFSKKEIQEVVSLVSSQSSRLSKN